MKTTSNYYLADLIPLLDKLPESQLREVYHYAIFIKERFHGDASVPFVNARSLKALRGLIASGGDALQDTEALYNE